MPLCPCGWRKFPAVYADRLTRGILGQSSFEDLLGLHIRPLGHVNVGFRQWDPLPRCRSTRHGGLTDTTARSAWPFRPRRPPAAPNTESAARLGAPLRCFRLSARTSCAASIVAISGRGAQEATAPYSASSLREFHRSDSALAWRRHDFFVRLGRAAFGSGLATPLQAFRQFNRLAGSGALAVSTRTCPVRCAWGAGVLGVRRLWPRPPLRPAAATAPGLALDLEQFLHVLHVFRAARCASFASLSALSLAIKSSAALQAALWPPGLPDSALRASADPGTLGRRWSFFDLRRDLAAHALPAFLRPLRRGGDSGAQFAPVVVENLRPAPRPCAQPHSGRPRRLRPHREYEDFSGTHAVDIVTSNAFSLLRYSAISICCRLTLSDLLALAILVRGIARLHLIG